MWLHFSYMDHSYNLVIHVEEGSHPTEHVQSNQEPHRKWGTIVSCDESVQCFSRTNHPLMTEKQRKKIMRIYCLTLIRLTIFRNTFTQVGCCNHPFYFLPMFSYGSLLSIDTKISTNHLRMMSIWCHNVNMTMKIGRYAWRICQICSKLAIITGFWLKKVRK